MLRPSFVGSFPRADVPLDPPLPELALIGRSNVGKSSLLNALVGQRIAKVSATPGKTRSLNVFLLDIGSGEWGVVRDGENRRDAATRRGPGRRHERADGGRGHGAAGGDCGPSWEHIGMTFKAVSRLGGWAVRATSLVLFLTAYPPVRLSAQDSLPIGYGTLKRDDIVVRFDSPELEIQFLPLEESVTRLLAPDTYRSLQDLLRSKRAEIDDLARRAGALRPVLAMVSFFGLVPQARFVPEDVNITSRGGRR